MSKIISNTPAYVWLLLIYLIWGGLKARKTQTVSWIPLIILPSVMFAWSVYANLINYGLVSLIFWTLSNTIGLLLGMLTTRHLDLKFDRNQKQIEIQGSLTPLVLSLSIFSLRYFLGTVYATHPELIGTLWLFIVENCATIISGMFTGRLLGFWRRYKLASP